MTKFLIVKAIDRFLPWINSSFFCFLQSIVLFSLCNYNAIAARLSLIDSDTKIEEIEITNSDEVEFIIIPIGINVGNRNVIASALVKGAEDGNEAINFPQWLIPFNDVVEVLKLSINEQEDGFWQINAPGIVTLINSEKLVEDPDLGLAVTVEQIQKWLNVPAEFDLLEYAIVFNPPWLEFRGKSKFREEIPVVVDGLPLVSPRAFTLTTIGQSIDVNRDFKEDAQNNSSFDFNGELTAIGTLLGGSWYINAKQDDLRKFSSWSLNEAQWWLQSESIDYIVGSQPTFGRGGGEGDYWGVTAVRRWGFEPQKISSSGFNPGQRFRANQVNRTVTGKALPGTLVQLVTFRDHVIREVLVDESGVYYFENIPVKGEKYRVFLYRDGILTAEPEIELVRFSDIPELLPKGGSVLTLSSGLRRKQEENFIGQFRDLGLGIGYRRGISEDWTVGVNLFHDNKSLRSLGEG